VKYEQFSRSAGFLSSIDCHGGCMPQESLLEWQRWDGQAFVQDNTITISVWDISSKQGAENWIPDEDVVEQFLSQQFISGLQSNTETVVGSQPIVHAKDSAMNDGAAAGPPCLRGEPVPLLAPESSARHPDEAQVCLGAAVGMEIPNSRSAVLLPRPPQPHQETLCLNSLPMVLRILTPNKHPSCENFYDLVMNCRPHGFPLWRRRGGNRWIYRGSDACWYVGGTMSKRRQFRCESGYVYHDVPGCFRPDLLTGPWSWGDTEAWHADCAIEVRPSTQAELLEAPQPVGSLDEDLDLSRFSTCSSFSGYGGNGIYSGFGGSIQAISSREELDTTYRSVKNKFERVPEESDCHRRASEEVSSW